ncbi:MAG: winged helix-turn-helix transcriptional regulator [Candidatus Levybacteria bacterium]|nr:winged helix-turn-helix transcriptional regulator [Candidatus Levybacteria bacterium]
MFNRSYIIRHEGHPHYLSDAKLLSLQKKVSFSTEEEELVRIIRNLSDPTKLKIYLLLHKVEEISVTDLTQILGMSHSAISHALSDLKNLGLVESHRCGQLICYSLLNGKKGNKILNFFNRFTD